MDAQVIARRSAEAMFEGDDAVRELGIEVEVTGPGRAEARLEIRKEMINGHDVCHGGYLFTLADTAFAYACNSYNRVTVAAGASIEFLRPAKSGDRIVATATEIHRGARTGFYDVVLRNQDGKDIAIFRGRSHSTDAVFFSP